MWEERMSRPWLDVMWTFYKILTKTYLFFFSHSCGKNTPVYLIFSLTSLICVGAEGESPLCLSAFAISVQLVVILSGQDFTMPPWGIVADVMGNCVFNYYETARRKKLAFGSWFDTLATATCWFSGKYYQWQMTANYIVAVPIYKTYLAPKI